MSSDAITHAVAEAVQVALKSNITTEDLGICSVVSCAKIRG